MSKPLILHVVSPQDRRAQLFADAARSGGFDVTTRPWQDVLDVALPALHKARWVRLDSPGHEYIGGAPTESPVAEYEVGPLDEMYSWLISTARRVEVEARGSEKLLTPASAVGSLFDKQRCRAHLDAHGISVPKAVVCSPRKSHDLFSAMRNKNIRRVFVKPRYGSSASGVMAVTAVGDRVEVQTTAVHGADTQRLVNGIGIRRHVGHKAITLIDELLRTCSVHIEQWFPKAVIDGAVTDVRIVTIAGQPCHTVARAGSGPITNLHAGNGEMPTERCIAHVGQDGWNAMLDTCRAVARLYPRVLHLGIDVAFSQSGRTHTVLEVNAFGDLLPRARWQGKTTYEVEVDALASGRFEAWRDSQATTTAGTI